MGDLSQDVQDLCVSLRTAKGLTKDEAERLLAQFGPNEPSSARRTAPLFQLLILLANPLPIFHASEQFFHTGWFVESLATQVLVIFVIRTARNPLRSRPSLALTLTTITIMVFGTLLPYT
jgi:hypothetical protein